MAVASAVDAACSRRCNGDRSTSAIHSHMFPSPVLFSLSLYRSSSLSRTQAAATKHSISLSLSLPIFRCLTKMKPETSASISVSTADGGMVRRMAHCLPVILAAGTLSNCALHSVLQQCMSHSAANAECRCNRSQPCSFPVAAAGTTSCDLLWIEF